MSRTVKPRPLGYLLDQARQASETCSLREAGKTATLSPQKDQGETVQVFKLEPDAFRAHYGLSVEVPVADAVFLYLREVDVRGRANLRDYL